jgi:hypothetical protein
MLKFSIRQVQMPVPVWHVHLKRLLLVGWSWSLLQPGADAADAADADAIVSPNVGLYEAWQTKQSARVRSDRLLLVQGHVYFLLEPAAASTNPANAAAAAARQVPRRAGGLHHGRLQCPWNVRHGLGS